MVVTKNSGGAATYGKIAAARRLGMPVVMVARRARPDGRSVADVDRAGLDPSASPLRRRPRGV